MLQEFRLPDLGEGLTESEVVAWRVAVGDRIELNQVIADIETAKAVIELPSPFAGTVAALHAEAGETIDVGAPLLSFDLAEGAASVAEPDDAPEPNLVGYGAKAESTTARRRLRAPEAVEGGKPAAPEQERPRSAPSNPAAADRPRTAPFNPAAADRPRSAPFNPAAADRPRSTPPVRKLARDLGIDLTTLHGTGEFGRITREDLTSGATVPTTAPAAGGDTSIPIKGVRKATAAAMVASAFTAPHVTEFLTIDVTATIEFIERLKNDRDFADHRITLLTIVSKAVCLAIARNPALNSSWNEERQQITRFAAVNLGIAAATQRGLVVPNITNAGALNLGELADALADLTATARSGAVQPADLRGGTFTITNIGVFGIDAGTPILNPGEAGILALGATRELPWNHNGTIALRQVLTLSLSFDHRVVDGAEGSRFLADVGAILHDPARVLAFV